MRRIHFKLSVNNSFQQITKQMGSRKDIFIYDLFLNASIAAAHFQIGNVSKADIVTDVSDDCPILEQVVTALVPVKYSPNKPVKIALNSDGQLFIGGKSANNGTITGWILISENDKIM